VNRVSGGNQVDELVCDGKDASTNLLREICLDLRVQMEQLGQREEKGESSRVDCSTKTRPAQQVTAVSAA